MFAYASIQELLVLIERGEVTPRELADFFSARCVAHNNDLNALIELFDVQSTLDMSREHTGKLAGIPGIIKDNICQKDRFTSCASKILASYRSTYDATVSARLKQQGALLLGRANMDEFAMGSSTETSAFGKARNPWDLERVPGGSSGGSAAAVAAGLVPWSLGSDTGGSVRQPAAFCGVVGMKPTYGLVSRYGLVAYASSFDQVGPITRTVYDNALVLSVLAGHDEKDSSSVPNAAPDYTRALTGALRPGLRIGVVDNALNAHGMDAQVQSRIEEAIAQFASLGAQIKRVAVPSFDYAAAAYFIISRAEAASNLARFDGVRYGFRAQGARDLFEMYAKTRHDGFGDEVRLRILVGNYVLSAGHAGDFYNNAQKVRRLIHKELMDTFADVDLLIIPTQPAPAFKLGAYDQDKLQMDLQDYFTAPLNLAGVPALSIPCGFVNNLPVGLQLVGPALSEELIYQTAHAYESVTGWHTMHPVRYK